MRLLFSVFSILLVSSVLTGCSSTRGCGSDCDGGSCGTSGCGTGCGIGSRSPRSHSHGICDCAHDDYCTSRSPWIRMGGDAQPTMPSEPLAVPSKLPDGKKGL